MSLGHLRRQVRECTGEKGFKSLGSVPPQLVCFHLQMSTKIPCVGEKQTQGPTGSREYPPRTAASVSQMLCALLCEQTVPSAATRRWVLFYCDAPCSQVLRGTCLNVTPLQLVKLGFSSRSWSNTCALQTLDHMSRQ